MKTALPKLAILIFLPGFALAHMVSMSSGELRVDGAHAHYELRMPSYELVHMQDPQRTLFGNIHFRSGGAGRKDFQPDLHEIRTERISAKPITRFQRRWMRWK